MKRSKFLLSNYKLGTFDMGELVPMGLMEVLPGDSIQQATSALIRVSPMLAPVMHPVNVRIHHWFVPNRIIWEDWEDFITGGEDGADASVYPTITLTNPAIGSLHDYLGIPNGTYSPVVSALPYRAYAKIFNEFYRDQDLVTALTVDETSGADSTTNTDLQKIAWEKDYFTMSRPWTQKGSEVTLPLGTEAPLFGDNMDWDAVDDASNAVQVRNAAGSGGILRRFTTNGGGVYGHSGASGTGEIKADLSQATAATINQLREAFALQKFAEARARYGGRYVEYLRYLGVKSSDARLQRPEYLGGGKQTLQFSEIIQSAGTTDGSATGVGDLKGHGIGALRSNRYRRFIEEHGFIVTMMSIQPKTMYASSLPRHWSKTTKEDFFQKELQHLGQQTILNQEVHATHASPSGTFGYQDRYDEYRRTESTVAGDFRDTLDHWHMARKFASDPALNSTFIQSNPTDRVFQSTATDSMWVMANHSIQARRMLTKVGKPGGRM